MKITIDTNILVRFFIEDDPEQADEARALMAKATRIVIPLPALCEAAWVLRRGYRLPARDIADQLERLLLVDVIVVDRSALAAGVAFLRAGGDFADGVIATEGRDKGGEVFVSFDRGAVNRWRRMGGNAAEPALLLSAG
ncbi:type II toxin-antitoxin system VapC family toxin [Nitrospirillum sp. BR 11828]|uniref:type II toxin-antitoxin system VapC family toxin n=1 Tax=Nitrospirillum sp. BR 11828 TaxID=3104325 RepID=UPI002ACA9F8B|nr:type II toxin-antitoxin system VapC family toxin [Nitrospirillum sp. BR 11828]MDZ5650206.1 type II toxin-antitoxin system VapC family toxin [Nitrospirillum sp. BR 11828]